MENYMSTHFCFLPISECNVANKSMEIIIIYTKSAKLLMIRGYFWSHKCIFKRPLEIENYMSTQFCFLILAYPM